MASVVSFFYVLKYWKEGELDGKRQMSILAETDKMDHPGKGSGSRFIECEYRG